MDTSLLMAAVSAAFRGVSDEDLVVHLERVSDSIGGADWDHKRLSMLLIGTVECVQRGLWGRSVGIVNGALVTELLETLEDLRDRLDNNEMDAMGNPDW